VVQLLEEGFIWSFLRRRRGYERSRERKLTQLGVISGHSGIFVGSSWRSVQIVLKVEEDWE
jgi:hypothetical protein